MPPPQGQFQFPGLNRIVSGSFTLSHGISPSAALVEIVPQGNFIVKSGPLAITYGSTRITFPGCKLDMANLRTGSGTIWSIRILDRRWKWQYGEITGAYNRLKPDNTIERLTEKTPRELASLLLDAMKETNYDVSQLPNLTRPNVEWDHSNPAQELAALCDSLGCRVVLGTDNRVRLCQLGVGQKLPDSRIVSGGYGFDPPELPDSLKIVCGPTLFQTKLFLEAVGKDVDGKIKPIDDLSYNPRGKGAVNGWLDQYPNDLQYFLGDENGTEKKKRMLALETVFKWYRITTQASGFLKTPGYNERVNSYRQYLPLRSTLVETETDSGVIHPQPKAAYVEGIYYDEMGDPPTFVNTTPGTRYRGSFSIDAEQGIVMFANPVYEMVRADVAVAWQADTILSQGSFGYAPARLALVTSYAVQETKTRKPLRRSMERSLPGGKFGTGPKLIHRDDLQETVIATYKFLAGYQSASTGDVTNWSTRQPTLPTEYIDSIDRNNADLEPKLRYYLDAEQARYQNRETIEFEYPFIANISPDGAVHQVGWQVGGSGARTRASRNSEFNLAIPDYEQRRIAEDARAARSARGLR